GMRTDALGLDVGFTVGVCRQVGAPPWIVNVAAPLAPPPGVGLTTRTEAERAVVTSDAGTVADALVALATVVARLVPSKKIVAPVTKLAPVTVSVKSALPAVTDEGDNEAIEIGRAHV